MKTFGARFDSYEPFSIQHMAIPTDASSDALGIIATSGVELASLPEIAPSLAPYVTRSRVPISTPPRVMGRGKSCGMSCEESDAVPAPVLPRPAVQSYSILARTEMPEEVESRLKKSCVAIAPTANAYKIPKGKKDLSDAVKNTMSCFDYYLVELGLMVLLNRGESIPELLLEVDLESNNPEKAAVTAYDMAPDDKFHNIKIVSGKLSLGVSDLLKLIPLAAGTWPAIGAAAIGSILVIDPWEFHWNMQRYEIDAAGEKNYKVFWKLYETQTVQSFNPTMVLKAKKGVKLIRANARVTYKLKTRWWQITPEIRSEPKEVPIWPLV